MKKYILLILLLIIFIVGLFYPFFTGQTISVKMEYMFYACDPTCPEFKVLAVKEEKYKFLQQREVKVWYKGHYLQEAPDFEVDNLHKKFYATGRVGDRNLLDLLINQDYVLVVTIISKSF